MVSSPRLLSSSALHRGDDGFPRSRLSRTTQASSIMGDSGCVLRSQVTHSMCPSDGAPSPLPSPLPATTANGFLPLTGL